MSFRALLVASALLAAAAAASAGDRSTCSAIWFFKVPCSGPAGALVSQVKTWSTSMYEIIKASPTALEIRRTSLSTNTTTEMAFEFTPPSGHVFCKIRARSTTTSQTANRPDDYCLLYNLINGSGLTHAEGYKEICNEGMCPSKESASCNTEEYATR